MSIVEELIGSKLTVNRLSSADLTKAGEEKLAQGDFRAFGDLLKVHNHADGAGNSLKVDESANTLVGVPYEDLRATLKDWLQTTGAI